MAKGIFIALEGGEATGKTTTAKAVKERLEALGYEVVVTREPGGIPSAEAIRDNIMNFHVDARTELLLYIAARREHLVSKVIPALESGKIVITDRFYISSLVYQGHARGLGMDQVRTLNDFACDGVYPDLNIIIDIPVEVSMERKKGVEEINRLDLEGYQFHQKVEKAYKMIHEAGQDHTVLLDGTKDMNAMIDEVFHIIKAKLEEK